MDQNPNTQNNNQNPRGNYQNNRGRNDNRFSGRDKQYNNDRNYSNTIKPKPAEKPAGQDSIKGPYENRDASRNKGQKGVERICIDGKQQSRNVKNPVTPNQAPQVQNVQAPKQILNTNQNSNNRYNRNNPRNTGHNEPSVKHAPIKRIETVEDIQADIERIDKDIQFEMKQIKAVKLGL